MQIFSVPCQEPPWIANATYSPVRAVYSSEDMVLYHCEPGFSISDASILTCNQGVWRGKRPVCELHDEGKHQMKTHLYG